MREIDLNPVQRIGLVFAQFDSQQDLGMVGGCLQIFGDRSLTPGHGGQQQHGDQAVGPHDNS
jgi:hypothetical protein